MNNIENLLNDIYMQKKGLSLIMDNQNITTTDIMNSFYRLSSELQSLGVDNFRLESYNVVLGNFITGLQYTKDNKTYYMMISADSQFSVPRQIAVGMSDNDKVYMMCEDVPSTSTINLMSFPKLVINQRIKGFSLGGYRDTMHLFMARPLAYNDESIKCMECGFEAINEFCKLANQVKNQDKRKKLSI